MVLSRCLRPYFFLYVFVTLTLPAVGDDGAEPDQQPLSASCACETGRYEGGVWARGEYLMWWAKEADMPPLATASPPGTPWEESGILGHPGTTVVFGGEEVDDGLRSGGRFTVGYWLSDSDCTGIEATYLFLGSKRTGFEAGSSTYPILTRPFFNVLTGQQDAGVVSFPDELTGSLSIGVSNELDSVEILVRHNLSRECARRLDLLAGYRYARFREDLAIDETTLIMNSPNIPIGAAMTLADRFAAGNEFHGAEVGLAARGTRCRWSLEVLSKLAIGSTRSRVTIDGATAVAIPEGTSVMQRGGLLALQSNIGNYERQSFTAIPELGATLGYQVTRNLTATFGYSLFYWSCIARPGDQIDLDLNPSLFPPAVPEGMLAPEFRFVSTDFWAQGLSFGVNYRF